MKAYIARDLWGTNEFYQILNENDPKFLKSIQVLENWEKYQVLLQKNNSNLSFRINDEEDLKVSESFQILENWEKYQDLLAENKTKSELDTR